ncbi:MAG: tetratricopeptide repeat protein [Bacteroidales bacterium]|nr:tetratricopeptide repeat protein [Bacteroidales bacterium]
MTKNQLLLLLFLGVVSSMSAQKAERKHIRAGNKQYKEQKYTDAEIEYRKGLEVNGRSAEGTYNLGNSLYRQNKNKEAISQYESMSAIEKDKSKLAATYHNMGNAYLKEKDLQKGIEAYKQALRMNPNDDSTRYNLALAQKMLSDQQQQKQDQQEEQKQEQKQEQQQQKQDQQKQQQQKQDDQQKQQQQPQPQNMSKQNAEQLLQAIQQDEKNTQQKVKEQQMQMQQRRKTDKDW